MKAVKKRLGAIVLGAAIVLAGCGGGQSQSSQGQNTLTLGAYETPWELTNAVDAYNARNGKYYVEIVDYGQEYQDYDTAKERFKLDMITSNGADIIWMGDLVADELGYAGVLADR